MFNFTTKEEYLAEVKEWKQRYKTLSENSRAAKKARKQFIYERPFKQHKINIGKNPLYDIYAAEKVRMYKNVAETMLEQRKQSKIEAGRQYRAAQVERELEMA